MRLKIYDKTNSSVSDRRKATIRIQKAAGILTLSKAACASIGIASGDKVVIVQDEDSPKDFYIHKTSHPDGFTIRSKSNNVGANFNSAVISNKLSPDYKRVSYPVGAAQMINGMSYHLIITANPLNAVPDNSPNK